MSGRKEVNEVQKLRKPPRKDVCRLSAYIHEEGRSRKFTVCEKCKPRAEKVLRNMIKEGEIKIVHYGEKPGQKKTWTAENADKYHLPATRKFTRMNRCRIAQKKQLGDKMRRGKKIASKKEEALTLLQKASPSGQLFNKPVWSSLSGKKLDPKGRIIKVDGKECPETFAQEIFVKEKESWRVLFCSQGEVTEMRALIQALLHEGVIEIENFSKHGDQVRRMKFDKNNAAHYKFVPTLGRSLAMKYWEDEYAAHTDSIKKLEKKIDEWCGCGCEDAEGANA